jgi:hypothetical protein
MVSAINKGQAMLNDLRNYPQEYFSMMASVSQRGAL